MFTFSFFADLAVMLFFQLWQSNINCLIQRIFITLLFSFESLVKALRLAFVNEVFKIILCHSARCPHMFAERVSNNQQLWRVLEIVACTWWLRRDIPTTSPDCQEYLFSCCWRLWNSISGNDFPPCWE